MELTELLDLGEKMMRDLIAHKKDIEPYYVLLGPDRTYKYLPFQFRDEDEKLAGIAAVQNYARMMKAQAVFFTGEATITEITTNKKTDIVIAAANNGIRTIGKIFDIRRKRKRIVDLVERPKLVIDQPRGHLMLDGIIEHPFDTLTIPNA